MLENIAVNKYSDAVDSYSALNVSSKVKGELIEKEGKNIKIDIGDNQALEIELRENVEIKKGETVLVDRGNILKSKVVKLEENIDIDTSERGKYSQVLKSLDIDVSEENLKTIKRLDNYGIDITVENFDTYMISKNSLKEISTSLDYKSAVRLAEMDIDIENESIQKIATLIGELEEEKEGFNILNIFKKKEINTEEAEEIAVKVYGNKMGKDIVDIIKTLHKEKVNITKKNIEKINDVFYKLENLKDIEDKTFVDTIKNKLDVNIDNLYKVKRYVKDENIAPKENVETKIVNANRVINIKSYEIPSKEETKVTNRELRLLEEDIKDLMVDIELEPSEENVKLSKEFIKRNMDVTKTNISSVDDMKKALVIVIKNLDKETAAKLTKENVDIETMDIREVAKKIEQIKNPEKVLEVEANQDLNAKEVKELKEELVKTIEILESIETEIVEVNQEKTVENKQNEVVENEVVETEIDAGEEKTQELKELKQVEQVKQEIINLVEDLETKFPQVNAENLKELSKTELELEVEIDASQDLNVREVKELKEELVKTIEILESIETEIVEVNQEKTIENKENEVIENEVIENEVVETEIDIGEEKIQEIKELKQVEQEITKLVKDLEAKVPQVNVENLKELLKTEVEVDVSQDLTVQEVKGLKEEPVKTIEVLENIDIEIVEVNQEETDQENINNILKKLEFLEKVDEKDILTLLEKNVDFKIKQIEQVIFGKREQISINKIEDITYSAPVRSQDTVPSENADVTNATLDGIQKISTAFTEIGKLDFNTIAFQMKRNIPMTIANIQKTSSFIAVTNNHGDQRKVENQAIDDKSINTDVMQALNKNGLETSRINIQKSMQAYRSYNNIKDNLTSNMVKQAVNNGTKLENMDINLASKHVDQYKKTDLNYQTMEQEENNKQIIQGEKQDYTDLKEYAHSFTNNAHEIMQNSDENIMLAIKNKRPLSFKELKETNLIFKNQEQIGHKISQLAKMVDKDGDHETKERFEQVKKDIIGISKSMKGSKDEVEEAYRRMEDSIKDVEDNIKSSNYNNNEMMKKQSKDVSQKLDESKVIAKENEIIQFPLYMNGQFTNLNMYFRDKQREGSQKKPEEISVVLSIDTVNMGNVNINLEIDKKNVNVKIDLENIEDKKHIESHKNILIGLLEQDGYSIGEISFYGKDGEDEIDILGLEDTTKRQPAISNGNLDITV